MENKLGKIAVESRKHWMGEYFEICCISSTPAIKVRNYFKMQSTRPVKRSILQNLPQTHFTFLHLTQSSSKRAHILSTAMLMQWTDRWGTCDTELSVTLTLHKVVSIPVDHLLAIQRRLWHMVYFEWQLHPWIKLIFDQKILLDSKVIILCQM